MARHHSRSRSPVRRKRYDGPRNRPYDRRSPTPSGLLVRNISLSARPDDLRVPFERFGPIKDVYLPKNYYTGESRGFGFVKFRHPEDAAEAKSHLDRTVIGGCEIRIVFAEENRKTPQEMCRISRISSHGSYRRQSPSMSPRRRNHSYSCSPSPARRDVRGRGHGARDEQYSPNQSRSISRSFYLGDDRNHHSHGRSSRHSKSLSRSASPVHKKKRVPSSLSPSPGENVQTRDMPSRCRSPRRNSKGPVKSQSRSCSPH